MKLTKINDMVFTFTESNGHESAKIILFHLFPGIFLGINYIKKQHITWKPSAATNFAAYFAPFNLSTEHLHINYCFEGRCEVKLKDGRYVYVDNNVLCIEDYAPQDNFYYPLGFYKGIEICIDKENISKETYEALDYFGINLLNLIEKYSDKKDVFIQIASDLFAKKSSEIISIWENNTLELDVKVYQLRFTLCQLLFYLVSEQAVNTTQKYNASSLSYSQYIIAIDCEKRITKDLSQKQTITSLASDYKVSPSSLKKFFHHVYGYNISEYLQMVRMKEAMRLLIVDDLPIMQIAASVGYENQSKFSAVFKKHTGYAPLEYKRIYNLKRNEETT